MLNNLLNHLKDTFRRANDWLSGPSMPELRFILLPAGLVLSLLILALIFSWLSPGSRDSRSLSTASSLMTETASSSTGTSTFDSFTYEPETPTRTSSLRGTQTKTPSPTFYVRRIPTKTNTPYRTATKTRTRTLTRTITQTPTPSLTRTITKTQTPSLTRTITKTTTGSATITATITSTPTLERLVFSGDASANLEGTPEPDGIIDIASMDMDGGTVQMIYAGTNPNGVLIAWDGSPDGNWFVVEVGQNAFHNLYLLRIDGHAFSLLPNQPFSENNQATWSPDGQWIIFRSAEGGTGDLYAIRPNGDDLRQLTNGPEEERMPDFSPDGQQLVYVANGDLWTISTGGLYVPTLTPTLISKTPLVIENTPTALPIPNKLVYSSDSEEDSPRWSPDGAKILFARKVDEDWKIYEAVLFTAEELNDANFSGTNSIMPSWSRDGKYVFFVTDRDAENYEIYRLTVSTGELLRLTNTSSNEIWPFAQP